VSIRVTELRQEVLGPIIPPFVQVTTAHAVVLADGSQKHLTHITAVRLDVLGNVGVEKALISQVYLMALCTITPNLRWIEMFVSEVFPKDISYNSIGATKFTTDVVIVDSGDDQRNSRWQEPLMEYDVAYGVRTMEDLHALIAFFRAMKGRLYGFLYDDHVDNTSTLAVRTEARSAPAITPFDQILGSGDGNSKQAFLVKLYAAAGGASQLRTITKPKLGTVRVSLDNTEVFNFTLDYNRGIVNFTSIHAVGPFSGITLTKTNATTLQVIGTANQFTGFANGQRCTLACPGAPLDVMTEQDFAYIQDGTGGVGDHSQITLTIPAERGGNYAAQTGVILAVHPAPVTGAVVKAGFGFYVPVRFDTDRLPVTIEEYGIGGINDVKLVEIRPGDALQ
jgi:uncharacterized protein (TIGR02217 family)